MMLASFTLSLGLVAGLVSSRAEWNLRRRLAETGASLRTVQAERDRQVRQMTETHLLLEERYAETYALYLIEQEIAAELDVDKILPKVTDIVLGLLGGRSCSILLADQERSCLHEAAVSGTGRGDLSFPLSGNPIARCWADNLPLSHSDLTEAEREFWAARGTNGLLCTPLSTKTERVGLILVEYDRLPQSLEDHRDLLCLVAGQISLALENAYLYHKVRLMATHDALTGLFNRHHLQERLTSELRSAGRERPLAAIILDIDHFKRVNDAHGHEAGDEVLRHLAHLLSAEIGAGAGIARWGGEEFVVLLAGTSLEEATAIAERIRARVSMTPCPWEKHEIRITVSLGVAAYPGHASDQRSLLRLADQGLYLAKRDRNRVAVAYVHLPQSQVTVGQG